MLEVNTITQILFNMAKTMGFFCLLFCVLILLHRFIFSSKRERIAKITKEVSSSISEILFFDYKKAKQQERKAYLFKKTQLREWVSQKEYRKIMVNELLKLQLDVAGGTKIALLALYKDLGLHLYAVQKLKSWRWNVISSAIVELSQMNITESYMPIRKFLNHKNKTIQELAQIAIISLKEEGIVYFMETASNNISQWQQLKIIESLKSKNGFDLPNFSQWFTSDNPDVVFLALCMADVFNQNKISQNLIQVFDHENLKIRELGYELIQKYKLSEVRQKIKSRYWQSKIDERSTILKTIHAMANSADIPFIEEVLQNENSELQLNQALRTMEKIVPEKTKKQWQKIEQILEGKETVESKPIKEVTTAKHNNSTIDKKEKAPALKDDNNFLSNYFSKDNFNRYLVLDKIYKMHNRTYIPILRKILKQEKNLSIKIKIMEIMQNFGIQELDTNLESYNTDLVI